jgi:hypothetical protein
MGEILERCVVQFPLCSVWAFACLRMNFACIECKLTDIRYSLLHISLLIFLFVIVGAGECESRSKSSPFSGSA